MTEAEWLSCADPRPMLEYLRGPEVVEHHEVWGRPVPVSTYPAKRMGERKARLFGVACCRLLADLYDESHCRRVIDYGLEYDSFAGAGIVVPGADCCLRALDLAERAADEVVSAEELRALAQSAESLHPAAGDYAAGHDHTDDYDHRLVATGEVGYAIRTTCACYPATYSEFGTPTGAFDNLFGVVWYTAQAAAFRKGLAFVQSTEDGDPENRARNAALLREIVGNPFIPTPFDPAWRTEAAVTLARGIYADRAFDRLPVLADALEDAGCADADVLAHCRGGGSHVRGCWVVDLVLGKETGARDGVPPSPR